MITAKSVFSKAMAPKKIDIAVAQRWDLFPYLLTVLGLLTLLSLFHVWSRVQVVDLNVQITEANRVLNALQQEKSRLKLEVASLKHPARIESLAKEELGMALPTEQQVVVVR